MFTIEPPTPMISYSVPPAPAPIGLDIWMKRGKERVRLYGRRPAEAPNGERTGMLRLVLQSVKNGMVLAWRPLFERWVTGVEALTICDKLKREGWMECGRPMVSFSEMGKLSNMSSSSSLGLGMPAPNNAVGPDATALAREKDLRRVADRELWLAPGQFTAMPPDQQEAYRQKWAVEQTRRDRVRMLLDDATAAALQSFQDTVAAEETPAKIQHRRTLPHAS